MRDLAVGVVFLALAVALFILNAALVMWVAPHAIPGFAPGFEQSSWLVVLGGLLTATATTTAGRK